MPCYDTRAYVVDISVCKVKVHQIEHVIEAVHVILVRLNSFHLFVARDLPALSGSCVREHFQLAQSVVV